jgi:hypothetical protein
MVRSGREVAAALSPSAELDRTLAVENRATPRKGVELEVPEESRVCALVTDVMLEMVVRLEL